jgi:hypothetical protein
MDEADAIRIALAALHEKMKDAEAEQRQYAFYGVVNDDPRITALKSRQAIEILKSRLDVIEEEDDHVTMDGV